VVIDVKRGFKDPSILLKFSMALVPVCNKLKLLYVNMNLEQKTDEH
jgi:hypothetical protein